MYTFLSWKCQQICNTNTQEQHYKIFKNQNIKKNMLSEFNFPMNQAYTHCCSRWKTSNRLELPQKNYRLIVLNLSHPSPPLLFLPMLTWLLTWLQDSTKPEENREPKPVYNKTRWATVQGKGQGGQEQQRRCWQYSECKAALRRLL